MSQSTDEKSTRKNSLKNVKWVSHYLGVSRNTVHQWVLEGHIPYINLGVAGGRRIIRFDPEKIETWLYARSYTPAPDPAGQGNVIDDTKTEDPEME